MKRKILFGLLILALVAVPLFAVGCEEEVEVITLKFHTPFQVSEGPCQLAYHYLDAVEERADGRILFERYPGGTLGSIPESLSLVKTGSVDLAFIMPAMFPEFPLSHFPIGALGAVPAAEMTYEIVFEIEETSTPILAEFDEQNVKLLYVNCMSGAGILSKEPFTSLADLEGKKVGMSRPDPAFEAFGITCVTVQPPDAYESLARGLVDAVYYAPTAVTSLALYEVASYYQAISVNATLAAGWPMAINLDTWNSLPSDIQTIFIEEGEAILEYSCEAIPAEDEVAFQTIEDNGGVVGQLPLDDTMYLLTSGYDAQKQLFLDDATNAGKLDEALLIVEHCDELMEQGLE